jgi:hypothetical protein
MTRQRSLMIMRQVFASRAVPGGLALVMFLGGCAGPMGTMRPGPSVPADAVASDTTTAGPVNTFDGSYQVTLRNTGAAGAASSSSWCASPGQPMVTVTNGQFTYAVPHPNVPGNATPVFPATIAADGSFSGQVTAGTISGSVNGRHMQGRIDGSGCLYEISGDRV